MPVWTGVPWAPTGTKAGACLAMDLAIPAQDQPTKIVFLVLQAQDSMITLAKHANWDNFTIHHNLFVNLAILLATPAVDYLTQIAFLVKLNYT